MNIGSHVWRVTPTYNVGLLPQYASSYQAFTYDPTCHVLRVATASNCSLDANHSRMTRGEPHITLLSAKFCFLIHKVKIRPKLEGDVLAGKQRPRRKLKDRRFALYEWQIFVAEDGGDKKLSAMKEECTVLARRRAHGVSLWRHPQEATDRRWRRQTRMYCR
ncbi:hypothetical protein PIB30_092722 [Stylosanthes scabra]|uniref:Uncharacterized protein n=1 Tax=Stylosanthes scabra TaxID=79078 RepID=A0ABU6ZTJ8_9FABA|nr:hypothetical protein [Stylosanthes scabra]